MVIILGIVFAVMVVMNGALFYVLYSAATVTKKQEIGRASCRERV